MFSKILTNKKYFISALSILILSSVLLNLIINYVGLYSISADESGRTIDAYKWVNGTYEGIPTWLPFYTWIVGYSLKLFPDLFVIPRIIVGIFGLLTFISFIWLTHELFKDRYITLLSSVIALFFPSRAILNAVPLSESMFFFFIFTGIALFTRWIDKKENYLLIFSALAFSFSSSVRYEGWIFCAAFILVLIIFKRLKKGSINTNTILIITFISLMFPAYWLIYQAITTGNAFRFFYDVNKNYEYSQGISLYSIIKNNFLTRFIHHNIIYLCFPGLFTFGYLFLRKSSIRKWASLPLIAFIPLVVVSLTGRGIPTHNMWRIPELWNILLIPFTAYFIKNINSFGIKYLSTLKKGALPLIVIIVLIYYSFHIYRFKHEYIFSKEELQIGNYLEKNIIEPNPENKILIEAPDWSFLHIIVASNNPDNFIKNSESGDPKIRQNLTINKSSTLDPNELFEKKINYVMAKTIELKDRIRLNPSFKGIKEFDEWYLYEINR